MLKRSRWLLLKRPEKLTGEQRGRLAELVRRNLRTVRAYLLKEDFQSLWGYVSPYWAGQFLDRWCTRTMRSRLDPMKEVARMVALAPRPDSELVPSPGAVLQWRCRRLQRKGQSDHQTGVWVPHLRGTGSRFVSRTWRPARTKTHPQILLTRLQKAVVDVILTPIYEPEFLGFSYGFRPGRGAHDALDALAFGIERRKVNWIIDADIRAFFDRLSRDHLLRFLEHRIGDKRVLRLIAKWLNAGVMEDDEWKDDLQGTPQGAVVSPILANVYLHYVLDLWFQKKWRARQATGDTIIVRYADDFVVGCQRKADAEQFLHDLRERMSQFALELHPDKTRLVEFGRFAMADRRARGERRPETFDFLGFTHYCKKKRNGNFGLGRKPIAKRVTRTLKRVKAKLRERMHEDVHDTAQWLGRVVNGWLNYYAVPTSARALRGFARRLLWIWLRTLRGRSQKDRTTIAGVARLAALYWPPVKVRHPWPTERFAVSHPR